MKRGDIIEVRHFEEGPWVKRMFLSKLNKNNYLCVYVGMEKNYKKGFRIGITSWRYIKKKH